MVIDTSALVAVLFDEPERRALNEAIEDADARLLSTATFVELSIVVQARAGDAGRGSLDLFLSRAAIDLIAVDVQQAEVARDAFSRFGKGRHRAALNFGDCFTYALAVTMDQPLLCKGNDFIHTDVGVTPY